MTTWLLCTITVRDVIFLIEESDGGAERDRTVDLCSAIAALSQLSYGPIRTCDLKRRFRLWVCSLSSKVEAGAARGFKCFPPYSRRFSHFMICTATATVAPASFATVTLPVERLRAAS